MTKFNRGDRVTTAQSALEGDYYTYDRYDPGFMCPHRVWTSDGSPDGFTANSGLYLCKAEEGLEEDVITIKVSDLPEVDDKGKATLPAPHPNMPEGCYQTALNWLARMRWLQTEGAKEAELKVRRDDWAQRLSGGGIDSIYENYESQNPKVKRAIDELIKAEDAS